MRCSCHAVIPKRSMSVLISLQQNGTRSCKRALPGSDKANKTYVFVEASMLVYSLLMSKVPWWKMTSLQPSCYSHTSLWVQRRALYLLYLLQLCESLPVLPAPGSARGCLARPDLWFVVLISDVAVLVLSLCVLVCSDNVGVEIW